MLAYHTTQPYHQYLFTLGYYLHNPNVHWNNIIGLDAAKCLVKVAVVYPYQGDFLFIIILFNFPPVL